MNKKSSPPKTPSASKGPKGPKRPVAKSKSKLQAHKTSTLKKWSRAILGFTLLSSPGVLWMSPLPLPALGLEAQILAHFIPGVYEYLDYKRASWQMGSLTLEKVQVLGQDLAGATEFKSQRLQLTPSLWDLIRLKTVHWDANLGPSQLIIGSAPWLNKNPQDWTLSSNPTWKAMQKHLSSWQIEQLQIRSNQNQLDLSQISYQSPKQELMIKQILDPSGFKIGKFQAKWQSAKFSLDSIRAWCFNSEIQGKIQWSTSKQPLELKLQIDNLNLNNSAHFALGQGLFEGSGLFQLHLKGGLWPLFHHASGSAYLSSPLLSIQQLDLQNSLSLNQVAPEMQNLSLSNFRLQIDIQTPKPYRFELNALGKGDLHLSGIYTPQNRHIDLKINRPQSPQNKSFILRGSMDNPSLQSLF